MHYTISFPTGSTEYYHNASYSQLLQLAPSAHSIIITDQNVHRIYGHLWSDYRTIIIAAGESSKTWETIQLLTEKLAAFEAHKNTLLLGIGGGMVTDVVGFLATIYMRGISFAFVPTTLLGMVDASIGGKNGINVSAYKNMLGSIKQPKFILYDTAFLESLPDSEWENAFAEIIKYACIGDAPMFEELKEGTPTSLKIKSNKINDLIVRCVQQKNRIVLADEQENDLRKTLNFGHTAGHAFETLCHLKHGQAVGLGMIVALIASEIKLQVSSDIRSQLVALLRQYSLPTAVKFDKQKVLQTLKLDKKRIDNTIDFILLKAFGAAIIQSLTFDEIGQALQIFADEYND